MRTTGVAALACLAALGFVAACDEVNKPGAATCPADAARPASPGPDASDAEAGSARYYFVRVDDLSEEDSGESLQTAGVDIDAVVLSRSGELTLGVPVEVQVAGQGPQPTLAQAAEALGAVSDVCDERAAVSLGGAGGHLVVEFPVPIEPTDEVVVREVMSESCGDGESYSVLLLEYRYDTCGWPLGDGSGTTSFPVDPSGADAGSDAGMSTDAGDGGTAPRSACDGTSLSDPSGDTVCTLADCDAVVGSLDITSSEVRAAADGWDVELVTRSAIPGTLAAGIVDMSWGGFFTSRTGGHPSGLDVELRYLMTVDATTGKIFYWDRLSSAFGHVVISENVTASDGNRLTFHIAASVFDLSSYDPASWQPGASASGLSTGTAYDSVDPVDCD